MGCTFKNGFSCNMHVWASINNKPTSIDKYVKSVSVIFDWDSDTKVSGSMEIQGLDMNNLLNSNVTIRYWQEDASGKISTENICKFYIYATDGEIVNGQWSGTVELCSYLNRMKTEKALKNNFSKVSSGNLGQGRIKSLFNYICRSANCISKTPFKSGVANESIKDLYCDYNDSLISVLKWCEGETGKNAIYISPDDGKAILGPAPTKDSPYKKIVADENSCIFPGLAYSRSDSEVVNRVYCRAYCKKKTDKGLTYYQFDYKTALLSSPTRYSWSRTLRYVDYVDVSNSQNKDEAITESQLARRAKRLLREKSSRQGKEWTFSSLKIDAQIGKNIQLTMGKKTVKGLCVRTELSMDASTGCAPIQTTTIREW